MACNETGWMTGDDFPLTFVQDCSIPENAFRAIWFVFACLAFAIIPHAISKLPLDVGELRRIVHQGAPQTLHLWFVAYGVVGAAFGFYKGAALWLSSDYTKLLAIAAHAMLFGIFLGPCTWYFFIALISPFLATAPESASLIIRIKKAFMLLGLFSSILIGAVIMAQAMRVDGGERATLSIVFLSSLAFNVALAMLALGIVYRKVRAFSFLCVLYQID
jgi:hypothetical protein